MDRRGEAFACGAPQGNRRLKGRASVQLLNEGQPTSSAGYLDQTVSRGLGAASPANGTIDRLHTDAPGVTPLRRRRSGRLADRQDAPPNSGLCVAGRGPAGDRKPRRENLLAGEGGRRLAVDRRARIIGATPGAAAWIGSTPDELIGMNIRQLPIALPVFAALEACLRYCESRRLEAPSLVHRGRLVEVTIHGFEGGATLAFNEVRDQREAPSAVVPEHDVLHLLSDAASAEMALLDGRGVVVSVNAAWRETTRRAGQATAGLGHRYVEVCRWISPQLDQRVVEKGIADLLSGASQSFAQTSERAGPQGSSWRRLRVARLRVGADVQFIAIHEDLTEVMQTQSALRDATEQLLSAQEDERHRIAVELHDSTSQHLVAVGIGLANLRQLAAKGGRTDEVIEDMSKSLKEAMKEIRVLSYLMNPPAVMRDGLETHARRFVTGFGARTGLQTRFSVRGSLDGYDAEVQHTVFRVIQEALANVYRHASATNVSVSLDQRRSGLVVWIADDGKGIVDFGDGGVDDVPLGVGIAGMRSRIAQLGGELRIASSEHGTIVTGHLPRPCKRTSSGRDAYVQMP